MLQNLFTVRIAKAEIPFRLEERGDEISEEGKGGNEGQRQRREEEGPGSCWSCVRKS
jgi:hypothetical protein